MDLDLHGTQHAIWYGIVWCGRCVENVGLEAEVLETDPSLYGVQRQVPPVDLLRLILSQ